MEELRDSWRTSSVRLRASLVVMGLLALLTIAQVILGFLPGKFTEDLVLATTVICAFVGSRCAGRRAVSLSLDRKLRFSWRCLQLYLIVIGLSSLVGRVRSIPKIEKAFQLPLEDTLRMAATFTLILGLASMTRAAPVKGRMRLILDGAISASSVAVLSWYFIVAPVWTETTSSFLLSGWTAIHPISEILVVLATSIFLTTVSAVKEWRLGAAILGIGVLAAALGGSLSTLTQITKASANATTYSFLWPLAFALIAWSTVARYSPDVEQVDPADAFRTKRHPIRQAFSLTGSYLVSMLSFGCVAYAEMNSLGYVSPGTFFLGAALMAMVAFRQIMTQLENQGLGTQMLELTQDLEQKVETRTAQLQSLYSLSKSVGNSLDTDGVIKNSAEHALQALGADALVINLTPFAFSGFARLTEFVRQIGLDDDAWVLDRLNILDSIWAGATGVVHDSGFKNHMKYVIAPVECKGKTLGWICVLRRENAFDRTDVSLLEGIGSEIGTALENARLYEVARQMADIDSVTGLLNHRATQERFEYMFKASEDMDEPMCLLMVDVNNFKYFNDTYGHLAGDQVLKSIARMLRDVARPHDIPARYGGDEFLLVMPNTARAEAEQVAEMIHTLISNEGYPEPGTDRVIPFAVSIGIASYPDQAKNRNELLYHADHEMFNQKRQTSTTAAPRKAIRKPTGGTGDSFDLLDSMISAVDNKDYYTRAHSEEVTEYALWIAQELGLSEEAQKTIRFAGLLHDVGKIGIPDEILRKPGHLTDEEYEVMKQHPVVGAMIVSSIPDMTDILPGVKHHHERWDGKGYPDALAGESIPLLARILAVPDTFSAMTTDRPYRKGMQWPEAMRRIKEGRGSQFDPQIVDAFFVALEKRQEPKYAEAA